MYCRFSGILNWRNTRIWPSMGSMAQVQCDMFPLFSFSLCCWTLFSVARKEASLGFNSAYLKRGKVVAGYSFYSQIECVVGSIIMVSRFLLFGAFSIQVSSIWRIIGRQKSIKCLLAVLTIDFCMALPTVSRMHWRRQFSRRRNNMQISCFIQKWCLLLGMSSGRFFLLNIAVSLMLLRICVNITGQLRKVLIHLLLY